MRLLVRRRSLPVRQTEMIVFQCIRYRQMRRCMRALDGLDEKEQTMDMIKGYVEENDNYIYPGEAWTERQRNERKCVTGLPVA